MTNAIKFTPSNNGEIKFSAIVCETHNNNSEVKIKFSIKDNGVGISESEKVF